MWLKNKATGRRLLKSVHLWQKKELHRRCGRILYSHVVKKKESGAKQVPAWNAMTPIACSFLAIY